MKITLSIALVIILLVGIGGAILAQKDTQRKPRDRGQTSVPQRISPAFRLTGRLPQYVEGELLVKYESSSALKAVAAAHKRLGTKVLKTFRLIRWQHVRLPKGMSVEEGIKRYKKIKGNLYVEPNYIYHTDATPNDPRFGELWGMSKIQAPTAWDANRGNANIVVAVIDTGVDYNHEDLTDNMWRNPGEVAGNGIDDDSNGYVDDIYGIDAYNNDSDPIDDNIYSPNGLITNTYHGTHVSGTIGGVGDNGKGVVGVNWRVGIMALKMSGANGGGTTAAAMTCFEYATLMKNRGINVRVTNNSWGGGPFSQPLKDAIDAAGNAGILSCCAAGNEGTNNDSSPSYPSSYDSPSIISVAASDSSDNRATFSNYGAMSVDIAAPGTSIWSTKRGNDYQPLQGTSQATPHVTGAAALILDASGSQSVSALKSILMSNVDVLSQWTGYVVSNGRLNLAKAIGSLGPILGIQSKTTDDSLGNNNGAVDPGESISMNITLVNNGGVAATGITGSLSTSTSGVSVTQANSAYPDIGVSGTGINNTAYQFSVSGSVACGTVIDFSLTVTTNEKNFFLPLQVSTGTTQTTEVYFDNMESGSANWTHSAPSGADTWAVVTDTNAKSPTRSWKCINSTSISDQHLILNSLTIPSGPSQRLRFWHTYAFENGGWDGAVLEISTDGGTSFADLGLK